MSGRELLLGRYELKGVLGRGGMAEVRDGWDTRLNRPVAVKLLHTVVSDPAAQRRFDDEARSAAALNHPNIVSVHDSGEDDGRSFIVMERLPGESLHDLLAQGPMAADRVRAVLDEVLSALAAAHHAGVLHRDIKPANILVSADRRSMKVADFGIAKTAGTAHTMTGQIVGTMAYMSPARIGGAPATVADDIYAVGVVGFEAVTGYRAFPQDNLAALARAISDAPTPSPAMARPEPDAALVAVIERAMCRDPQQRFGSADEMRAALHGGPAVRPPTKVLDPPRMIPDANYYVPPSKRRSLSRNQKFFAAAATFLALLVTVLVLTADREPAGRVSEPVSSTSAVPPPPPTTTIAPPVPASSVAQLPEPPKGEKGRGNGNGNGNGPKKRD